METESYLRESSPITHFQSEDKYYTNTLQILVENSWH